VAVTMAKETHRTDANQHVIFHHTKAHTHTHAHARTYTHAQARTHIHTHTSKAKKRINVFLKVDASWPYWLVIVKYVKGGVSK